MNPSRLLDPAPALRVHWSEGCSSPCDIRCSELRTEKEYLPIAQEAEPFPLTRRGPSVNGAIKQPDVVEHELGILPLRVTAAESRIEVWNWFQHAAILPTADLCREHIGTKLRRSSGGSPCHTVTGVPEQLPVICCARFSARMPTCNLQASVMDLLNGDNPRQMVRDGYFNSSATTVSTGT